MFLRTLRRLAAACVTLFGVVMVAIQVVVEVDLRTYARNGWEPEYFDAYREDLKAFARAAFYLTARDFDFVAALVIRYQRDFYRRRLGEDLWASLPDWQRAVMLGVTRDLYVRNVGRLGYNLYALPELNCVRVASVAASAIAEPESIGPAQDVAWRPSDYLALWAGAATKLRVLSELWGITTGTTISGLPPTSTPRAASWGLIDATSIDPLRARWGHEPRCMRRASREPVVFGYGSIDAR